MYYKIKYIKEVCVLELSISNDLVKEKMVDTDVNNLIKELQKEINKK